MPLSQAELDQRAAEDAVADSQRYADQQARQAAREQKTAADAARKADLSRQELEMRAQGMIPLTTADGNLHPPPLWEQEQAEKAAKEQAKAAKESAALTAKQQRADLTRQGIRHASNPVDGSPIPFETADDVARRRTEAAQQRRNQKLDDEIRAAKADHNFQLADYESKGFKPLARGADGSRPLETKALPKLKQDALFALQSRLQEQAKAVSGDADWVPFNESPTPAAQSAKQRLEALSQPGAELSEDDLAELEANDATKPLVARIRGIQTQLAKDDEINTLTATHKSRLASLELKRANPDKWFEAERQRRASLTPDQLAADLETSSADLDARRADLETRAAALNGQVGVWSQKLDVIEAQAAERRQRGIMAGELVTYTREDGTTEDWPRDLAAQREHLNAQLQNTQALQQDDWSEIQLHDQEWQREAGLINEAAQRLQTTQQEKQQTAKAQFSNRLRYTPGFEQTAGELDALQSEADIRTQDLADMHPDGVPEEAQKALQDDIQQKQQAALAAGQQRQQAAQAAYQGLQTALRPDKDGNTKAEIEVRPTIISNLAEALQVDPQEAERLMVSMETLNWEASNAQDVKEKTPEEFAAKAKAIRDSADVGGFVSAITQTAADIWQDKPLDTRQTRLLPNGAVIVHPRLTTEQDYTAAVNASKGTPEAKAEALARFPDIRHNAGAQVRESFRELEGVYGKDWIKDWLEYDAKRPQDVTPEEWAMRFTEERKNDSAVRRVAQEIGWSFYKGGNQLRQQASGLFGGITGSEPAMQDATWAGRKAQAMQTSKELYGSASDNWLRAGILEMTPEVATSIIPAAGGAKIAQWGIRGLAATGAGARLFPALAAVLEGSSTAAQAVKATQTLTRAGLAGASLAGGAQTYGAQISDIYGNLRRQGIEHTDALRMAQTPAILSAGVTAALTALGGASGVERLLVNPASAKALFAKQFETQMKRLGFVGQKFAEGGLREFALEELPDEIFSTWQSGVASHPDDPAAGRKALGQFLKQLPEFAIATGLLGGAGEGISAFKESSVSQSPSLPVSQSPANLPEIVAAAESAIDTLQIPNADEATLARTQDAARGVLYIAQGTPLTDLDADTLAALDIVEDPQKPGSFINGRIVPNAKTGVPEVQEYKAGMAPVNNADGTPGTRPVRVKLIDGQPVISQQTLDNLEKLLPAVRAAIPQDEKSRLQKLAQPPGTPAGQAPAANAVTNANPSPVQAPADIGTQPTRSGNPPAQSGAPVADSASSDRAKARDREYEEAVKAGDLDKAQELVDEAAREAGLRELYHGSSEAYEGEKIFEDRNTSSGADAMGIYMSPDRETSEGYGQTDRYWVDAHLPGFDEFNQGLSLEDIAAGKTTPVSGDGKNAVWRNHNGTIEIVVNKAAQIRSSRAVVKDANGRIIPPSERFSTSSTSPAAQQRSAELATLLESRGLTAPQAQLAAQKVIEAQGIVGTSAEEQYTAGIDKEMQTQGWIRGSGKNYAFVPPEGSPLNAKAPEATAVASSPTGETAKATAVTPNEDPTDPFAPPATVSKSPSPPVSESSKQDIANRLVVAKARAMKSVPVAARKRFLKFITPLSNHLGRFQNAFPGGIVFTDGKAKNDLNYTGAGIAVANSTSNPRLEVNLAELFKSADHLEERDLGSFTRRAVLHEVRHLAALKVITPAQARALWKDLTPALKARVYASYFAADIASVHGKVSQKQLLTLAAQAVSKSQSPPVSKSLPKADPFHMAHEFLRMLDEDAEFAGQTSEAMDASPSLGQAILDFLRSVLDEIKRLIATDLDQSTRVQLREFQKLVEAARKKLLSDNPADRLGSTKEAPAAPLTTAADTRASVLGGQTSVSAVVPRTDFKPVLGSTGTAYTDSNDAIEYQWAVVDVNSLNVSNNDSGRINPAYPQELQPRDRTSAASEAQVNDIAKNFNLDRLAASSSVGDGAPIVGQDAVVESGNGRVMGARRAHATGKPSASSYRAALIARASEFGLNAEQVEAVPNPVLVRVRTTDVNRAAFVLSANVSTIAPKREMEQAKIDSKQIVPDLFDSFVPSEDGDIFTAANADFIRGFISAIVPPAERGQVIDASGNLSQSGLRRIRNALFVHAYGTSPEALNALGRLTESIDAADTSLARALLAMSPRFAEQNARIANGALYPFSITENLAQALQKLADLRARGEKVETWLQQDRIPGIGDDPGPVTTALVEYLHANRHRPRQILDTLDRYAKALDSAGDPRQISLFGDEKPDAQTLWKLAANWKEPTLAMGRKSVKLSTDVADAVVANENTDGWLDTYISNGWEDAEREFPGGSAAIAQLLEQLPQRQHDRKLNRGINPRFGEVDRPFYSFSFSPESARLQGSSVTTKTGPTKYLSLEDVAAARIRRDGKSHYAGMQSEVWVPASELTLAKASTSPSLPVSESPPLPPKTALKLYRQLSAKQERTIPQQKALDRAERSLGQLFLFNEPNKTLKPAEDLVLERQTASRATFADSAPEQLKLFMATKKVLYSEAAKEKHLRPITRMLVKLRAGVQDALIRVVQETVIPHVPPRLRALMDQAAADYNAWLTPRMAALKPQWDAYKARFTTAIVDAYNDKLEALAADLGVMPMTRVPLKGDRGMEKAILDAEDNSVDGVAPTPDVSRINDVLRASLVAADDEGVARAVAALRARFKVVKFKDRFTKPAGGYHDWNFIVEVAPGLNAEVQVHRVDYLFSKEIGPGHLMYEDWRRLNQLVKQNPAPEIAQLHRRLSKAMEGYYTAIAQAFNISRKAASSISTPSLSSREPSAIGRGTGDPRQVIGTGGEPSTSQEAGSPSTSKNFVDGGNVSGIFTPEDTTETPDKQAVRITTANISDHAGNVDVTALQGKQADWKKAFTFPAGARMVPLSKLVSPKNELESPRFKAGLKPDPRQTAANFITRAIAGEPGIKQRAPLDVSANPDGTYTIHDGNATAQALMLAGWKAVPVNIVAAPVLAMAKKSVRQSMADWNRDPANGTTIASNYRGGNAWLSPDRRFYHNQEHHYMLPNNVDYTAAMKAGFIRLRPETTPSDGSKTLWVEFYPPLAAQTRALIEDQAAERGMDDVTFDPDRSQTLAKGRTSIQDQASSNEQPDLFAFNTGLGLDTLLTPRQKEAKLQQSQQLDLFGGFPDAQSRPDPQRPARPARPPRPSQAPQQPGGLGELFAAPGMAGNGLGGRSPLGTQAGQSGSLGGGGNPATSGSQTSGTDGQPAADAPTSPDSGLPGMSGLSEPASLNGPRLESLPVLERPAPGSPDRNFEVPAGVESLAPATDKAKILANVAAIKLLKELEADRRNATPEEKKILAAYTGWGAFKEAFNSKYEDDISRIWDGRDQRYMPDWLQSWQRNHRPLHKLLRESMSEDEFASASASTLNAHYTAAPIIRAMWKMVERLGFTGGRALEPSAGAGHYLGLTPANLADKTQWQTVELDDLSARLLSKLYPEATVNEQRGDLGGTRDVTGLGFERARIPNGSLDLVISNVPFHESGPRKKGFPNLNLHNFFFAHALDKVKPGGLVAFITSESTMQNNMKQRDFIASKGDLVAAFRLPNNAFKGNAGTEVTTDIIILRKPDGTFFKGQPWRNLVETGRQTITLVQGKDQTVDELRREAERTGDIVGKEYFKNNKKAIDVSAPIMVNEYFVNHPQHALGTHTLASTMYRAGGYALVAPDGLDVPAALDALIPSLPSNIVNPVNDVTTVNPLADRDDKPFSFKEQDGKLYEVQPDGSMEEAEWGTNPDLVKTWRSWKRLSETVEQLVTAEASDSFTDEGLAQLRRSLNIVYDSHVLAHKPVSRRFSNAHRHLYSDPGYPLTAALENEVITVDPKTGKKTYSYKKADIFTKRIGRPIVIPKTAKNVDDALELSLAWKGHIDPAYASSLLGITPAQFTQQALTRPDIFENPNTSMLEQGEEYLAGNVRSKLETAEAAAQDNPRFQKNVDALRAAQPERKEIARISPVLGARWIPAEVYNAFIKDVLQGHDTVEYIPAGNSWIISGAGVYKTEEHGTERKGPASLFKHALDMTEPVVYDGSGENRVFNPVETAAAKTALDKLRRAFIDYVKTSDTKVTISQSPGEAVSESPSLPVWEATENAFNETQNSYVTPRHVGAYLKFPGLNTDYVYTKAHRRGVIARFLNTRRGMMAHGVGSGKTFNQIILAQEMRRLGLAKKPMIVVQNATLGQFAKSYLKAYPSARILVPTKGDFEAQNRRKLVAKIATGNWDAIILPHSQFDLISNKPSAVKAYMDSQIDELMAIVGKTKDKAKVRDLEGMVKRLKDRRQDMLDKLAARQDTAVMWEDLGIDALIMDEAHNYKSLPIITRMGRVKGVPASSNSQRAINFMLKCRDVQSRTGGKNIFLATGTPIKNSMAEAYIMMQFMAPDVLEDFHIHNFDDFATSYGQTVTEAEMAWGGTPKMETRFAKFQNGSSLVTMIRTMFDVAFGNEKLGLDVPKIKGGEPEMVIVPATPAIEQFNAWTRSVNELWKEADPKEKEEYTAVPIQTMAAGIAAALDPRLLSPTVEDHPGSKVNEAVRRVAAIYKAGAKNKTTQIIFSDLRNPFSLDYLLPFTSHPFPEPSSTTVNNGQPPSTSPFDLYKDIQAKLIASGIPAAEIHLMQSGMSDVKKAALFEKVDAGEIRVIIGSTELLGVGVNIQTRLKAVHHLMPPRDFTPAMMEQRNGRIIRQGNLHAEKVEGAPAWNEDVEIVNYGTEGSMDSAIYGTLARKQRFITQLLMGEDVQDTFDDPTDPVAVNMAEMAARTLGDPDFIRRIELEKEIKDLRLQNDAFTNELAGKRSRLARLDSQISNGPGAIAEAQVEADRLANLWKRTAPRPEGIKEETDIADKAVYEFGGLTIDTATKDGAVTNKLDLHLLEVSTRAERRGNTKENFTLTINGQPLTIEVHQTIPGTPTSGYVLNNQGQNLTGFSGAASLIQNLHRAPGEAAWKVQSLRDSLAESETQSAKLRAKLETTGTFPDAARLAILEQEAREVDERLRAKSSPPPSTTSTPSIESTLPDMTPVDVGLMTYDVERVIDNAAIEGNKLFLPDNLDRKLYLAVNAALESAGGRWNKKAKAHIFKGDPRPYLGLAPMPDGTTLAMGRKALNFTTGLQSSLAAAAPAPASLLQQAFEAAQRGQSSQWLPIRTVWEHAQRLNPALTPAAFMRSVKAGDDAGTVFLSPPESAATVAAAGPYKLRNASGIIVTDMTLAPVATIAMGSKVVYHSPDAQPTENRLDGRTARTTRIPGTRVTAEQGRTLRDEHFARLSTGPLRRGSAFARQDFDWSPGPGLAQKLSQAFDAPILTAAQERAIQSLPVNEDGVESKVYLDRDHGVIYKRLQTGTGDPSGGIWPHVGHTSLKRLDWSFQPANNPRQVGARLAVMAAIGGTPTEIAAIGVQGHIYLKQPLSPRPSIGTDTARPVQRMELSMQRSGLVPVPDALKSYDGQGVTLSIVVEDGRPWLVMDTTTAKPDNFIGDHQGNARINDPVIGALTAKTIAAVPGLAQFVKDAAQRAKDLGDRSDRLFMGTKRVEPSPGGMSAAEFTELQENYQEQRESDREKPGFWMSGPFWHVTNYTYSADSSYVTYRNVLGIEHQFRISNHDKPPGHSTDRYFRLQFVGTSNSQFRSEARKWISEKVKGARDLNLATMQDVEREWHNEQVSNAEYALERTREIADKITQRVNELESRLARKTEALEKGIRVGNGKPITTENQREQAIAGIVETAAELDTERASSQANIAKVQQEVSVAETALQSAIAAKEKAQSRAESESDMPGRGPTHLEASKTGQDFDSTLTPPNVNTLAKAPVPTPGTLAKGRISTAAAYVGNKLLDTAEGAMNLTSATARAAGLENPLQRAGWNHLDRAASAKLAAHTRWLTTPTHAIASRTAHNIAANLVSLWTGSKDPQPFLTAAHALKREFFPDSVMPREVLAKKREMEIKTAMGSQRAMDLVRALAGNPKFSDLAYPKEFAENPMHRRNLYEAMTGERPMSSLPPELQALATKLRGMLVDIGKEAVKQGRMNTDTFDNLRGSYMPHYYKEDVQKEKSLFHKFRLGVRDILAQRTTAWHIVDTSQKDANGEPRLVSHTGNQWRFRNQEHMNAFFEDFITQQALAELQNRYGKKYRSLTAADLMTPSKLDPEVRGRFQEIKRTLHQRYDRRRPLTVAEQEKAGLIMDPVYAIARYAAQMAHDNSTAEWFNFVAADPANVSDIATPGFTEIPDNPRFGRLAGKFVQNDIAQQVLEMIEAPNIALQIYDTTLGWWKAGKTVLNPGTHVRNVLGNIFFSQLAGNSVWNPGNVTYYREALQAIRNGGPVLTDAYDAGVLGADFVSAELRQTLRQLLPDPATIVDDGKAPALLMGIGKAIGKYVGNPTNAGFNKITALYQAEDEIFKLAAYLKTKSMLQQQQTTVNGSAATPQQLQTLAAEHVRKWFPYFDAGTSGTLKLIGRTALPFLGFYRESIRIFGHALKERPLALAAGLSVPSIITMLSAMALGLDDDDLDEIKADMRGRAGKLLGPTPLGDRPLFSMLLPVRSDTGQVQQFDISAIHPFVDFLGTRVEGGQKDGWWPQMFRSFVSAGPLGNLLYSNMTGEDAHFGSTIVEPNMTTGEAVKARLKDAAKTILPPLAPFGTGFNTLMTMGERTTSKTLEVRSPAQAMLRTVGGLDVRNATPDLYRLADDWRKEHGYEVQEGMDYGSTTPASRARKALFSVLAQDEPNPTALKNILNSLEKMGHPVRTEQDVNRLLFYRDPAKLIGGNKAKSITASEAQAQFRASLQGEARAAFESALQEYRRIQQRAPMLVRQAASL